MQEKARDPGSAHLSLEEYREIFEARAQAKELERKRLSRRGSSILIGGALLLLLAILVISNTSRPASATPDIDLAAKSAEIQRQLSNSGGGDPLTLEVASAEASTRQGDLKFALDLVRYMQSGVLPPDLLRVRSEPAGRSEVNCRIAIEETRENSLGEILSDRASHGLRPCHDLVQGLVIFAGHRASSPSDPFHSNACSLGRSGHRVLPVDDCRERTVIAFRNKPPKIPSFEL